MLNTNLLGTRYRKTKILALALSALMLISPLTACSSGNGYESTVTVGGSHANGESQNKKPSSSQVKSLDEIHPTITQETWYGQKYYVIDEESLLQIIELAMKNTQEFYTEIGAPNMVYDKNLNIVDGKDNFYPEWQNKYFYMARAMSESSRRIDLVTTIPSNTPDNYAHGIMQICPTAIKDTLEQYYSSIFHENIDLSKLEVVPNKTDLANANTSKEAMQDVVEAVYNNIFLSMCYDVYNIKNINPKSHADYYAQYGGFNDDVRRLATIGLYGTSRATVINGLKNGNLEEKLRSIDHMNTYLNNLEKYEAEYARKFANTGYQFDGGLEK